MKSTQFWEIIETSIHQKNTIDKSEQGDAILAVLSKLYPQEILGFHHKLESLKQDLNTAEFNDIAFMMKYGDNRTALSGFKNWVIALGKEHYQKAKKSPSHLLTLDDPKLFVAGRAYLNDLDLLASVAYDDVSKEDDLSWYAVLQKDRRMKQLNKEQNIDIELEQ
jgi:hypothetical protein